MKSNVLLRNLLLSTSTFNLIRHEKDKKKTRRAIGQLVGMFILYLTFIMLLALMAMGYGELGLTRQIPALSAISIIGIEFIFTFLKTNGYLFAFKDYDTLMSLPFTVKQVVSAKFLYMYCKNLSWAVLFTLPMEISYGLYAHPSPVVYLVWSLLALLMPLIPMVLASVINALITGLTAGFRFKKALQIFFTIIFVLLCFSLRFIIDSVVGNGQAEDTLIGIADSIARFGTWYVPLAWFEKAVTELSVVHMILYILISVGVYELAFSLISLRYKSINGKLMTGTSHGKADLKKTKVRTIEQSIAFNEWKRFTSSVNYFVNNGLGQILTVILCVALLFVNIDTVIAIVTQGAPVSKEMLVAAVPLVVFFLLGMTSTCTVSPSLEGKQLWLIESLPITRKQYYHGKMLFNLYLTVPFAIVANVVVACACGASGLTVLLCVLCGLVQCWYNTTWGMVCGLRHIKTNWNNEMEVIKQGSAVAIYMLPNMFITMGLVVLAVCLGLRMDVNLVILMTAAVYAIPGGLSHLAIARRMTRS